MTELIIHTKTFLPAKDGNEELLKLIYDTEKKDFIIKYKGFGDEFISNRFSHYNKHKLGGVMMFSTNFTVIGGDTDKNKDKQCDDFIDEIIPLIKERLGIKITTKTKQPRKPNEEERRKEARWLSDLETLKKHFNKFKRDKKGFLIKDTKEGCELKRVLVENSDRYVDEENKKLREEKKFGNEEVIDKWKKKVANFYGKKDLAKQLLEIQPIYYDEFKNWWVWDKVNLYWKIIDETYIMVVVSNLSNANTINSKEKNEILESLKQTSRLKKPKDIKPTWIQFKDKIVDIKTGEQFKVSSEYFVTNPIPYKLHNGNYELTPTMDRIFEEWVGEDYVKTLYEILAYCLLPTYPIHRLFCFIGGGMNGKSKFLELLRKFIGEKNVCSTELDSLINSRFEITRLHKKLVCQMGETDFNEMNKTSIIKKLTGGDLIGYEYKNKDPFEEYNYAKIMIATNNLPTTTDKTVGFYRRWLIIDFPNQFSEKKDILAEIPEEEYESLALKCTSLLHDLLEKKEFHNEGNIQKRMERYESKSDFLQRFLDEFIEEEINGYISKSDFLKKFREWCKENKHREVAENTLGKKMKEKNIEAGKKHAEWLFDGKGGQMKVWLDLKWKE